MRRLYGKEGDRLPPNPAFRHGLLHTLRRAALGFYWFPLGRPPKRPFTGRRKAKLLCLPCHGGRVPDGARPKPTSRLAVRQVYALIVQLLGIGL